MKSTFTKLAALSLCALLPVLMAPRNGSGTYQLPAGNPVVTGTTISSTVHNNTMSDLATALTGSLAKNGETTPTANLPMGTFRHTSVGNPTARNQYGTVDQIQDGDYTTVGSVSGTNTLAGSLTPAITAYVAGMQVVIIPVNANTSATTLNLNSVGALDVQKYTAAGQVALAANDLRVGIPALLALDTGGDDWVLMNPYSGAEAIASLTTSGAITATGTVTGGAFTTAGALTSASITNSGALSSGSYSSSGTLSAGAATVTSVTASGALSAGTTIGATGTITGGNLTTAGTVTSATHTNSGAMTVGTTLGVTGTITGGNLTTAGTVTSVTHTNSGAMTAGTTITATGTITGGALTTAGALSAGSAAVTGALTAGGVVVPKIQYMEANGVGACTIITQSTGFVSCARTIAGAYTFVLSGYTAAPVCVGSQSTGNFTVAVTATSATVGQVSTYIGNAASTLADTRWTVVCVGL